MNLEKRIENLEKEIFFLSNRATEEDRQLAKIWFISILAKLTPEQNESLKEVLEMSNKAFGKLCSDPTLYRDKELSDDTKMKWLMNDHVNEIIKKKEENDPEIYAIWNKYSKGIPLEWENREELVSKEIKHK